MSSKIQRNSRKLIYRNVTTREFEFTFSCFPIDGNCISVASFFVLWPETIFPNWERETRLARITYVCVADCVFTQAIFRDGSDLERDTKSTDKGVSFRAIIRADRTFIGAKCMTFGYGTCMIVVVRAKRFEFFWPRDFATFHVDEERTRDTSDVRSSSKIPIPSIDFEIKILHVLHQLKCTFELTSCAKCLAAFIDFI